MAKLKPDDIRNMADTELEETIANLKQELYKLQCERKFGRVEKPHRISQIKKGIARIYTILREKNRTTKTQNATQKQR